jgi:hypothetical protein
MNGLPSPSSTGFFPSHCLFYSLYLPRLK